mmetsp:Transcript_33522/g.58726  ORF Transcript_33522/g.58726 Transcript_33522/m.58726 type:complete len:560 (+) Transcript_33522:53-1732(+)
MEQAKLESDLANYSWPGVITFLQEQSMFVEEEKTVWLIEKKQLEDRIILLDSEVKSYAISNDDLMRRVKMLELTLRQERIKYAKFSGGHHRVNSDLIAGILNKGDSNSDNKHPVPKRRTRVHRQLLEKYLQELGFEDIFTADTSAKPPGAHHRPSKSFGTALSFKNLEQKPVPLPASIGLPPKPESRVEKAEKQEHKVPEIEVTPPAKPVEEEKFRKNWLTKSVFKSHVDAVRGIHFTQREEILVTASDDYTLKMWDISGLAKFTDSTVHEPYFTMRGHRGPIFSLTGCAIGSDQLVFTAGSEGVIKIWQIKGPSEVDTYGEYPDRSLNVGNWSSHTEAIWSLAHHPNQQLLLSASADGVVKVWRTHPSETCLEYMNSGRTSANLLKNFTLPTASSFHIPTSTVWYGNAQKFAVGYTSKLMSLFDAESSLTSTIPYTSDAENSQANALALSQDTVVSGHEDKCLRLFDTRMSTCAKSIVGHTDAVSCVSAGKDSQLVSGGHDGSLRFWDTRTMQCYHEISAHRKKYDEAVTSLAHCPSMNAVMSGGADSLVKLFACIDE